MRLEVNSKTNINIRHRYNYMELDIEDADNNLVDNVIDGLKNEYGLEKVVYALGWDEEDIKVLFECFKDDFERLGLLDKE